MWKESYRTGVELIDRQHKELFRMVDGLMKAIAIEADNSAFQEAITFLKNYVVKHFNDEEAYQRSVSYCGIEEHQKLHRAFTNTVLDFEKRLEESDYDIHVVKELAGMLTAWLIYHVADADQRIVKNIPLVEISQRLSCIDSVTACMTEVLEKMAGLPSAEMSKKVLLSPQVDGDVLVNMWLVGAVSGHVYFSFSEALAFKLIEIMMASAPSEADEIVCSALGEISNIAIGNAATALSVHGACEITTPAVSLAQTLSGDFETVIIDTGVGELSVSVEINRPEMQIRRR